MAHPSIAAKAFKDRDGLLQQVLLELDDKARPWLRWSDWLSAQGYVAPKPKAYLHFNQYDQMIQAAIEGHGVALGRVPLVLPMLKDGRLVAQPNAEFGASNYAYWLVQSSETPRAEVRVFSEWIIKEARPATAHFAGLAGSPRARAGSLPQPKKVVSPR